ncbi:MAG: phospho-N-acetylmuramoyl-pentapeptide-transferase [Candidatus Gastranaerophilales bacterium]
MIMLIVAFLLGMILCLLFGVPYVDFLQKKMIGQYVKDCAPEAHLKKQGTPTTGGIFIVSAIVIASVTVLALAQKFSSTSLIILLTLLFYTFAGFLDDYIKIKGKGNDGLTARGKLMRQIAIAMLPTLFLMTSNPEFGLITMFGHSYNLGFLYPIFAIFIITGASNAYNLTDGLDGLASFTGVFAFLACSIISLLGNHIEAAIISAVVAGALIGFLRYNKPKAQVFMGDTGSLALGGLLGTLAVMAKFEILLIFVGGVFVMETLSVILQVASYKLTGKRIFKMSPIHHHFELCDWSEKKIVLVFGFVSLFLGILAICLRLKGVL